MIAPAPFIDDEPVCNLDCEICGGVGWVSLDVPYDNPKFGKVFPCPNRDMREDYYRASGLLGTQHTLRWEDILDVKGSNIVHALNVVKKTYARGYGWVYLYSENLWGVAKSLVLRVLVAEAIRDGREARYLLAAQMIDDLRAAFDSDHPSTESNVRLKRYIETPILALDELEKVNSTKYAEDRKFMVLEQRYNLASEGRQGITVMAGNASPEQFSGELASRMRDGRFEVVEIKGVDLRPGMTYE